jgi:hypothetical protein
VIFEATWNDGIRIRFRDLTFIEHRRFWLSSLPMAVRNMRLYETVLIEGPPSGQVPAGIVAWVSYSLLENSPFTGRFNQLKQAADVGRAWLEGSYLESARALIAGTFHISFDELDKMTVQTFFQRLAQAEFLVGNRIDPADPKQPAQKRQSAKDAKRARARQMHQEVEQRRQDWSR